MKDDRQMTSDEWIQKVREDAAAKIAKKTDAAVMRTFESGATRNLDENKLDYEGFLSPLVLERYAQYMHKHRKQADGKLRDSDNWQRGMPIKEYMKSLWRHVMDVWRQLRGLPGEDEFEDSVCAVIFNASGMLHERLKLTKKLVTMDELKQRYPEMFIAPSEVKAMQNDVDSLEAIVRKIDAANRHKEVSYEQSAGRGLTPKFDTDCHTPVPDVPGAD